MKVFIADNSELMRSRLQEHLTAFNDIAVVGISDNGRDALDNMKKLKPDLSIIDIDMPELNGFEVLKEIRKIDKKMKIIILTLNAAAGYREKAISLGTNYFFSKADGFDCISTVIRRYEGIFLKR